MKEFFWAVVAAYVFLYFYAAWLYDGFSVYLAVSLFIALILHVLWLKKRKAKQQQSEEEKPQVAPPRPDTTPMSVWHSPLPYMVILAIAAIMGGVFL